MAETEKKVAAAEAATEEKAAAKKPAANQPAAKKAADGEGTKFVTFAVRCKYSIIAPRADSRCCGTN